MEENKMGTIPVSRLVISMALPLMLSLLINSLYNFVDSVFVARVSEDALTAISLAAPMQLIVSSLGLGNAVGLNAVISRALGEKNQKKVKDAASAALFLAFCSWILTVFYVSHLPGSILKVSPAAMKPSQRMASNT